MANVFCHCSVAIQCPDSATKRDLVAYLERISLYCHQLNITSKVKADVQNISGELIVSGVSFHHYHHHCSVYTCKLVLEYICNGIGLMYLVMSCCLQNYS